MDVEKTQASNQTMMESVQVQLTTMARLASAMMERWAIPMTAAEMDHPLRLNHTSMETDLRKAAPILTQTMPLPVTMV